MGGTEVLTPREFFAVGERVHVATAPGRLDVMGGIADYSGSLVLPLPLEYATTVMAQLQDAPRVNVVSLRGATTSRATIALDTLLRAGASGAESLGAVLPEGTEHHWASYVYGVAHTLLARGEAPPSRGVRLFITSSVPEGKGVSSSAALEVASLAALAGAYGRPLAPEAIAAAAQWAENHVAGAACGIMDQMTSACGRAGHLLRLRCQPATIEGHVSVPDGYRFYGVDSGLGHVVAGVDYETVRTAAFMGYRIIASMAGLPVTRAGRHVHVDDPQWHGYLANIPPQRFADDFEPALPRLMSGAEFLARYDGITDTVTSVDPSRMYPVRVATAHPVRENARVERFAELLGKLPSVPEAAREMGVLMRASHDSYGACGLGSDGTDLLVSMVEAATEQGLFGAKITGGGSGGTVAVFGRADAEDAVRAVAARYAEVTGRFAEVFTGSRDGVTVTTTMP